MEHFLRESAQLRPFFTGTARSGGGGGGCCSCSSGGGGGGGNSDLTLPILLGALAVAVAFLNQQIIAAGRKRKRRKKRSTDIQNYFENEAGNSNLKNDDLIQMVLPSLYKTEMKYNV